jgi:hypothetical protein
MVACNPPATCTKATRISFSAVTKVGLHRRRPNKARHRQNKRCEKHHSQNAHNHILHSAIPPPFLLPPSF